MRLGHAQINLACLSAFTIFKATTRFIPMNHLIYLLVSYADALLCLCGALYLFLSSGPQSATRRADRTLGVILLAWFAVFVPTCIAPNNSLLLQVNSMSTLSLLLGNLYAILTMLYPLELAQPGWISLRRIGKLLAPYLVLAVIYFVGLAATGEQICNSDDIAGLLLHIGEFNVWFRVVLYIATCVYMVYLLAESMPSILLQTASTEVQKEHIRHYKPLLNAYLTGMFFFAGTYLTLLVYGQIEVLIVHRLFIFGLFGTILYKIVAMRHHRIPGK